MVGQLVGRCTGIVVAVPDLEQATGQWRDALGFSAGSGNSLKNPETGQTVTLVELNHADPAMSLAIQCEDIDASLNQMEQIGYREYWRDASDEGTRFIMCRDAMGVFALLYQKPAGDEL